MPGRSSASRTPTACGQKQIGVGRDFVCAPDPLLPNASAHQIRFCRRRLRIRSTSAEGVGALLAGDGLRSSPDQGHAVSLTHHTRRIYCRCPADRRQAGLLRPAARSRSASDAITSAHQIHFCRRRLHIRSASAEGVGALLAGDGLRSSPDQGHAVSLTHCTRRIYCRCPADRRQAGLLRPAARSRSASDAISSAHQIRFCRRRRSLACRRWAAQQP